MKPFKFAINISSNSQARLAADKQSDPQQLSISSTDPPNTINSTTDTTDTTKFKRQKTDQQSDDHSQLNSASINQNTTNTHNTHDDGSDDDDDDDDWEPMPLLPPQQQQQQQQTNPITTNDNDDDNDNRNKKRPNNFADWDNDSDYSDDNNINENNTNNSIPQSIHTKHISNNNNNNQSQLTTIDINYTTLPSLYNFDYAILYPLQQYDAITAITTTLIDLNQHTYKTSEINYNTTEYNLLWYQTMHSTNLFDSLLLHCGSHGGQLTTIDFTLKLFQQPLHTTIEKCQTITKLLPIQYYNPNPNLYRYDSKARVEQYKEPIHLIVLGSTNQFFALSQHHKSVSISKGGYSLRLADKEPGHIAPIRDITFSPTIPISSTASTTNTILQQFGLLTQYQNNIISKSSSSQLQQNIPLELLKWQQTYIQHLHRTVLITGGDDSLIRVWHLDRPPGFEVDGHMQYLIEKTSTDVYRLITNSLTPLSGPVSVYHSHLNMKFLYHFNNSIKLRITTICQITSRFVLIGTYGGLIFAIDLSKNVKESIWVINPTQYFPIPTKNDNIINNNHNEIINIPIQYDEFLYIKQFLVISPTQVLVIVTGTISCCFIFDITNFEKRPTNQYYNTMTIFFHQELEITTVTPTYSNNLPQVYHQYKICKQHQNNNDNTNNNDYILPNVDGLLCGVMLGVSINKTVRTQYVHEYDNFKKIQIRKEQKQLNQQQKLKLQEEEETLRLKLERQNNQEQSDENDEQNQDDTNNHNNDNNINIDSTTNPTTVISHLNQARINTEQQFRDKVYTIDQLNDLEEEDKQRSLQQMDELFSFPHGYDISCLQTLPEERQNIQAMIKSRPGNDIETTIGLLPQNTTILQLLLNTIRYEFNHDLTTTAAATTTTTNTQSIMKIEDDKIEPFYITPDASFIIPISFNLPSQNYSPYQLPQSQHELQNHLILIPTIESITYLPDQPIYSSCWFKNVFLIGSHKSFILLPNTALQTQPQKNKYTQQILQQLISIQTKMFKTMTSGVILNTDSQGPRRRKDDDNNNSGVSKQPKTDTITPPSTLRFNPNTQHRLIQKTLATKIPLIQRKPGTNNNYDNV